MKADYVDGFYDTDVDTDDMMFDKSLASVLSGKVQGSSVNMAPEFEEGARAMRYVPEDAMKGDNVGKAVVAKDDPMPTYQLGGGDAGSFEIDLDTGQITVKANAKLDHERKPTHTVTVTATDSHNVTDTITVTINVTDADEPPAAAAMEEYIKIVDDYTENDTVEVADLDAVDPEEASPVLWSLLDSHTGNQDIPGEGDDDGTDDDVAEADIADAGVFKISDAGVLTFDEAPDYENPADAGTNNEYKVVVQASDGTEMNWFKVTVEVTDVEEEGSVKLSPTDQLTAPATTLLQPQVLVEITAHSLTDPDGTGTNTRGISAITTAEYQWYRTSSRTSMGTEIDGTDAEDETYTPRATADDSDVGSYLRVVATYTDGRGSNKTAVAVSEHRTIAENSNNTAPEFPATSTARAVPEETAKGTAIGNPVTATDKDSGEILTYWLGGDDDASKFAIDAGTGQLMVKTVLDFEGTAGTDNQCATTNACSVTVMVADSSGADPTAETPTGTDSITVAITVTGVDEKPISFMGATMIVHEESAEDEGGNPALMDDTDTVTYTATDPEGGVVTLTLSGDDDDKFKLTSDEPRALEFKEKPDFENPGDKNGDNLYEVTVVASDGANSAMRNVTVKVTNMEEGGAIEVMPAQPRVGTELTAELTDSDGIVSGPTWQWYKQMVTGECSTATEWEPASDPGMHEIEDATLEAYTPVSKDDGYCLRVKADYVDGFYDTVETTDDMMFDKSLASVLSGKVQGSSMNMAPEFEEGTRAMRYVPEDAVAMTGVGKPVMADDPNGDILGHVLGGADAGSFEIILGSGQIMVKANAKLDHESKPTHIVTVTATDPHNATDTITVTIHVTDVDERPKIMVVSTENQAPVFRSSSTTRSIPEGQSSGRPIGATVTATDLNPGDSLTYTLEGTDAASFSIHSRTGQLRTSDPLDQGTKSTYTVTVRATDRDGLSDTITVTITVTEAEEQMGEVTLWVGSAALTMAPQVGDTITGAVMDPDVPVNVTAWQWARTTTPDVMASWMDIDGATEAAYMVMEGDTGHHLRVMATYTDAVGTDMAMEYSPATMMVGAEAGDTLLDRYDANGNRKIDRPEVLDAIRDFVFNRTIERDDVVDVIRLFVFSR